MLSIFIYLSAYVFMSDVCICLNVFTYVSVESGKEHKSLRVGAPNFIELPNLCVGVKPCSL